MIQYIIAAGIGAFLGSQSKKSKKSYAEGGETESQYGSWSITIEEDENDEDLRNEEVARLIKEGYTSGYYPTWHLKITNIEGDLDEASEEHIAELVKQGYTSGQVIIEEYAKGGKTDEYVAITLKPKKSAYRGGKGEIYKNMQVFYDTINSTDNKDKYEFIHSLFISDSRKSDPKDISEIKVYMIGEKSGFDDVEKRGLYDFFDLVKTKEEVKDYAKGGKT